MKRSVVIAALAGLALVTFLVVSVGFDAVLHAALKVGWSGFGILILIGLGLFVMLGCAWYALIPRARNPNLPTYIWGRMIRDAAGEVLPFSQVGGFVIGARAVMLHGVRMSLAFASTVVDITTEMMAQIVYVSTGIALLLIKAPHTDVALSVAGFVVLGLVIAAIAAALFIVAQRRGFNLAVKIAERWLPRAITGATAVNDTINEIYERRGAVAISSAIHLAAWFASALGTWAAFHLMGTHVSILDVFAIEAVVYAARSAAFIVPNAIGVQEAAYAVLTPLFGVGPEVGVALSLLRRARDVAIGVPALLIWQAFEGHRALSPGKPDEQLQEE
jgi:putative membrane protein